MEVYPERQKRQKKTRFVCNFNRKSVFRCTQRATTRRCVVARCTQRATTQRRVITLGPIFIKMVLNRAQGLKEKSQEFQREKITTGRDIAKNVEGGADSAPPALLGLRVPSVYPHSYSNLQ